MDIKELSVGDLVYVDYKAAYIKAINETGIICHIEEYNNAGYIQTTCFEPIPLTEEFFEKNGFEYVDDDMYKPNIFYESKNKRVMISNLTNSGDGYWCVHVDNDDFDTIGSCDVRYVHEMQHLLRLCKYELDLKI